MLRKNGIMIIIRAIEIMQGKEKNVLPLVFLFTGTSDLDFKEYLYLTYRVDMLTYTIHTLRSKYSNVFHSPNHDAEDIVSNSFWKVFKNIELIDRSRSDAEIKAYLFTILNHQIYDHCRRSRPSLSIDECENYVKADEEDIFERIVIAQENEIVKRAIACLPEPYNSTLTLHYLTDKTPKEVSALLGVSLSAVYGRIYEGKRKLIAYLKEEGVNVDEYFCIE